MDIFTGAWNIIKEIISWVQIITVIDPWMEGVQVRMGKVKRTLKPGWWFIRPFDIDDVFVLNVKPSSMELDEQALTTDDDQEIVVKGVIMWSIFDIKKAIVDVENVADTLGDIVLGIIQDTVETQDWSYLRTEACRNDIKKRIQQQARKWGVTVSSFKWQSIVRARTFKVFGDV